MAVDTHKSALADFDARAVDRLVAAHDAPAGTIDGLPGIEDPYAVQAAVVRRIGQLTGAEPVGWKLAFTLADPPPTGLTAAPAYGRVLSSHLHDSGVSLPVEGDPLVECEIMVRARSTLDTTMGDGELLVELDGCAMVEVPVSRFERWFPEGGAPRLDIAEFIADGCLASHFVTAGPWVPLRDVDLAAITVELSTPAGIVVPGAATAVMGSPLSALRWLLGRIDTLEAGQMVATGTMTPAVRGVTGTFRARFAPPFGEVIVIFGEQG